MKFKQYIKEEVSEIWSTIEKECKPFLKQWKTNIIFPETKLPINSLFRGMNFKPVKKGAVKIKTRKDNN